MLEADLVVTAAGQTMLEAVATGAPTVALPLVENQARQAELLAERGAVRLVSSEDVSELTSAAVELARSTDARRALSANGQAAVDGYGALRVAYHLARLATVQERS
jgi:spore coat polysaccharide biosynthesis predicted glycosyltransferase SpsG